VEARDVVNKVTDYLNVLGDSERIRDFVLEMECQHRTLQQGFTRLCIAWLKRLADPDFMFDDRNKASVELAKRLKEYLDNAYLPLI